MIAQTHIYRKTFDLRHVSGMKCCNKRCSVKNEDSIVIFYVGLLFVIKQRCRYKHLLWYFVECNDFQTCFHICLHVHIHLYFNHDDVYLTQEWRILSLHFHRCLSVFVLLGSSFWAIFLTSTLFYTSITFKHKWLTSYRCMEQQ